MLENDRNSALAGMFLGEEAVETMPENITTVCVEVSVDMSCIMRYFDSEPRKSLQQVRQKKIKNPQWKCEVCTRDLMIQFHVMLVSSGHIYHAYI